MKNVRSAESVCSVVQLQIVRHFETGIISGGLIFIGSAFCLCGLGSIVGIATGYGLDGPGIKSRWGRDFPHLSRPALGPALSPVQWLLGLPGGKERLGRDADPSPLSSAMVMKG
jgi:hypothetical protein